ncbi:MAG TPA: hypothetical protein CFH84_07445 [Sulfurimonas sp. UBA12504]|nr:MAG TPA: hypothetical protein CFH84_07445 [Sulfurimonas sp. UBA12504]
MIKTSKIYIAGHQVQGDGVLSFQTHARHIKPTPVTLNPLSSHQTHARHSALDAESPLVKRTNYISTHETLNQVQGDEKAVISPERNALGVPHLMRNLRASKETTAFNRHQSLNTVQSRTFLKTKGN